MTPTRTFGAGRFGQPAAPRSLGIPAPAYPGRIATNADLIVAVDRQQTTLLLALTPAATSMTVLDPTNIVAYSLLSIDNEIVKTIGPPAGNVIPISRGFDGTTPAAHLANAPVSGLIDAYHHNGLVAEIEAIETALGPNLSRIAVSPEVYNTQYNFPPQTPGGSLSPGNQVITLTPVPNGVNGSDTRHYLYISGGTGAPEAVPITGGTAVSGAASGTVIVTCANSHTGAWTIRSATAGIAEAQQYVSTAYGGGTVRIVTGNWTIYGSIAFQPNMQFVGYGATSVLIPATSSLNVFIGNVPVKGNAEYTINSDNVVFRDFTIDGISLGYVINSCGGIVATNSVSSTEGWSYVNIQIINIDFNGIYNAITFHRVYGLSILNCRLWYNSKILISDSSAANSISYYNANTIIDKLWYNWHPMISASQQVTMTVPVITLVSCESTRITNCNIPMRGSTTDTGAGYGIACFGGEDYIISQCVIVQTYVGIQLGSITNGAITYYASFVTISECSIDQIWGPAVRIDYGTGTGMNQHCSHIQIIGNEITDLIQSQGTQACFILIYPYTNQVMISNNLFRDLFGSTGQTGIEIFPHVSDVVFGPNLFDNEGGDWTGSSPVGIYLNTPTPKIYGLENNLFPSGGRYAFNITDGSNNIASTAALAVPSGRRLVTVTGTTAITSIVYDGMIGDIFTLLLTGAMTVVKGSNLKLNSNFVATGSAAGALTLAWDGTNAVELSRSANS